MLADAVQLTGRHFDDQFWLTVLADAVQLTGRQEDDCHCDGEAPGVILLKFSHCLHCSVGGGCVFCVSVKKPTHKASRCDFLIVRCLSHRTMPCSNMIVI